MSLFRSIKRPFDRALSTKVIGGIVLTIYIFALALSYEQFAYFTYKRKGSKDGWCIWNGTLMLFIPLSIKNALLMNILPLTTIIIIQILSYRAIKKSALQFNFDAARVKTLKKVRKTFIKVVIVFFTLVEPSSTYMIAYYYIALYERNTFHTNFELLWGLRRFFNLLLALNSVVNPFIYAKIQRRFSLYRNFRQFLQFLQNIRQSNQDRGGLPNQHRQNEIELQQM